MAESFAFSAPVVVVPPVSDVSVFQIHKVRHPEFYLRVIIGNTATGRELVDITRTGVAARAVLRPLNKADLSAVSEERRILEWAQTQDEWTARLPGAAGAVAGSPD